MTRPSVVPMLLAVVVAVAVSARAEPEQALAPVDQNLLLTRVAAYLDTYERAFGAAVADEDYSQSAMSEFRGGPARHRHLKSDLMLLDLSGNWVEFRDVYEVDGARVRDHDARLQGLFTGPSTNPIARAQRIADESASYNLGVERNINVPTMALAFLARRAQPRSAFRLNGADNTSAGRAMILSFTETAKPTLIRAGGRNVSTQGRAWIAPDTGAVLKTELTCVVVQPKGLTGTMTVTYALEPALKLLAPVRMEEQYVSETGEIDRGDATYSDFHTFGVDTSTLVHRGGGLD